MRKSSIALTAALVAAIGFALVYNAGDSNVTAAPLLPAPKGDMQDKHGDFAGAPGEIDTSQQLPPNHPPIGSGATGAAPTHGGLPGFALGAGTEEQAPSALAWKAPATWSSLPNPNPIRLATYKVPRAGSDKDDAELAISRAGGEVEANVSRWAGQFEGAGVPKETSKTVHDLKVTMVSIEGTYQGGMGPSTGAHEGWALLGAIVETKGESYFFKVIGPAATVHASQKSFDAMIESITEN